MPYGTVNADVIGTSVAGANIGAGNSSIMKNRIINGAMVIDQRNAGASDSMGTSRYTLDRWYGNLSVASKYSVQQNAGSATPPTGFSNYLGVTSSSAYAVGAGEVFNIAQYIEGFNFADLNWGTANAKTITLSFWIRSSLIGTFGGALQNSAQNRSYPFTYSIPVANTWTSISVTIAGDTAGTWVGATNGIGLRVLFSVGTGSTFSGSAGTWAGADYRSAVGATSVVGTNGATWQITGVQLEVGSFATGFEYRQHGQELALCQRYFYTPSNVPSFAMAWVPNAAQFQGNLLSNPVSMRATPTVSGVSSYTIQGITASATGFSMSATVSYLLISGTASNGQGDGVLRSVNPNQQPLVSAEL